MSREIKWGEWRDDMPDWADYVDPIQFLAEDGSIVTATGGFLDELPDGEGDYYPHPDGFEDENGNTISFHDYDKWRTVAR